MNISRSLILISSLLALPSLAASEPPAPEGVAAVGKHAITFNKPTARLPTGGMAGGPLLGNGDIGVVQGGNPEALKFFIGKNDFWGMGKPGTRAKTRIENRPPAKLMHHSKQEIGGQEILPVGLIQFMVPALEGASFKVEQDLQLAETRGTYSKGETSLSVRSLVDANGGLLIQVLTNSGKDALTMDVRNAPGLPIKPAAYVAPKEGDASFLLDPDGRPEGRKVGVATRVLFGDGARTFTLKPGASASVITAILSDLDVQEKNPLVEAKAQVAAVTAESLKSKTDAHRAWWHKFWGRSFVEIPDKVIEQHWYSAHYVMASCSRAGKVAPGLWGNWITGKPAWHGDFHLNYNFEAPYYALHAANHVDETLPYYDALNQAIPVGKRISKARGWKGIHLPVAIGPWGMAPYGEACDWGQRSNAAFAALPFIWHWQMTQDVEWLKNTGYEYLRETAEFWEGYLTFENGRYVVMDNTFEGSAPARNPVTTLGLVKALFANIVPISEAAGKDADKRAKWKDINEKLSDFPTQESKGKTIFRFTEDGLAFKRSGYSLCHIYPAGCINLNSNPNLLEISRNTIDALNTWSDGNNNTLWYTACARVGYNPATLLANLRVLYNKRSLDNRLINFNNVGGIEGVSTTLAVTEMLFQSQDGILRFFPCWPKGMDARFGGIRAVGAFLVRAEIKGEKIDGVKIVSEKGRDCTVVNPWPEKKVKVIRDGTPAESVSGERFTLKTTAGEILALKLE
jgi:alpha-L-fucosidase 2